MFLLSLMKKHLRYTGPEESLRPILEELEFKTMLPRIFASTSPSAPAASIKESKPSQLSMFGGGPLAESEAQQKSFESSTSNYKKIETDEEIRELIERLKSQKEIAIEVATNEAANLILRLPDSHFHLLRRSVLCSH